MNPDTPPSPQEQPTAPPVPAAETPQPARPPKKPKSHSAFLLAFTVVLLLGVIGWLLYDKYIGQTSFVDTTETASDTPGPKPEAPSQRTPDPTADWTELKSEAGKYSLKHPKTWVTAKNPEFCTEGLTLLGTSSDKVGKCASDSFGQIAVASYEGDRTEEFKMSYPAKPVAVSGAKGVRYEGKIETASESGIGPAVGTKEVVYVTYDGYRTYHAMYYQYPGEEDLTADFDLLVTRTLTFLK